MAIVKISDLPLVDQPVEGTDLFVVVQDNVTKKAYASDIQTYVGFEEIQYATAGQTVFNLTTMSYAPGGNNLMVFVDGVNQYEGLSYTETNSTRVTFSQGLHQGAVVKFSTVQTQTSLVNSAGAVTFLQAGTGAVARSVQSKLRDTVSVKDFGAVGDGVANDHAAIQAALNSGAKSVYLPSATYRCDSTLNVPRNVSIVGDGPGQSVLNFSNAPSIPDGSCILTAAATYTALPALGANITVGAPTMTFSSAPSLSPGDIVVIYNPTDYSWSGWRNYYRAGEYARVAKVSGNVVTIEGGFADSYTTAAVDLYKLTNATTCLFAEFSIIGSKVTADIHGLGIRNGVDCTIRNVKATNCSYSGIYLDRCYNANLIAVSAKDDSEIVLAGDYGLIIGNSQVVQVQGGEFMSARHGITIGGGGALGSVPNRYLTINGAYIANSGLTIQAADIHGNAEFVSYLNCYIDGSIVLSGDNTLTQNCTIKNAVNNGKTCVYFSELKGCNHVISNNMLINNFATQDSGRGFFIDCGGNGDVFSPADRGGTFMIDGNHMRSSQPIDTTNGIYFHEVGAAYTGTELRNIVITNNKITRPEYTSTNRTRMSLAVHVRVAAGLTPFGDVTITNNDFYGGFRVLNDNANDSTARIVRVENNKFFEGLDCNVGTAEYVYLTNNRFQNIQYYVAVSGSSAIKPQYVNILANDTINCAWGANAGSSTLNADIVAAYCAIAILNGNNTAGDFQILEVVSGAGGFTVGETITGASSGKTAVVYDKSNPFISIRDSASGTFTGGETITGSSSGHTAVLKASNYQQKSYYYHLSYFNNGTVYVDHNISYWGTGNYNSGNSSVITTI